MLIDIKSRLDETEIQELLEYSISSDPGHLEQVIDNYQMNSSLYLLGYVSEDEIVGIIGFKKDKRNDLIIEHIAVNPVYRGLGYGRGLILEAIDLIKPLRILAETDDDAVDFYRWIGFEIESLGEKYPGVERYRCTFNTDI